MTIQQAPTQPHPDVPITLSILNNHLLHIAEDEDSILDGAITQKTINDLAYRYNAAASGESFTELPPEVQTTATDIAYQYGSNLGQQMPNFWSDLTQERW